MYQNTFINVIVMRLKNVKFVVWQDLLKNISFELRQEGIRCEATSCII